MHDARCNLRSNRPLLSTAEAAALARTTQGTVQAALRAGKLRGARLGGTGHWRILEVDLWAWAFWIGRRPAAGSAATPDAADHTQESPLIFLEGEPERWVSFEEAT